MGETKMILRMLFRALGLRNTSSEGEQVVDLNTVFTKKDDFAYRVPTSASLSSPLLSLISTVLLFPITLLVIKLDLGGINKDVLVALTISFAVVIAVIRLFISIVQRFFGTGVRYIQCGVWNTATSLHDKELSLTNKDHKAKKAIEDCRLLMYWIIRTGVFFPTRGVKWHILNKDKSKSYSTVSLMALLRSKARNELGVDLARSVGNNTPLMGRGLSDLFLMNFFTVNKGLHSALVVTSLLLYVSLVKLMQLYMSTSILLLFILVASYGILACIFSLKTLGSPMGTGPRRLPCWLWCGFLEREVNAGKQYSKLRIPEIPPRMGWLFNSMKYKRKDPYGPIFVNEQEYFEN